MSNKILVVYATRTGSTARVAEAIGQTLTAHGIATDVLPMQAVSDISPYDAVIGGSAINGKLWLPEAMAFLQTHQATLRQKPFAAFLVCMTKAMSPAMLKKVDFSEWLAPVRALVPTVSEGYFAGALYINKVEPRSARLGFRISVWLGAWKEGVHTDWAAVCMWGDQLAEKLVAVR